MKNVFRLLLVPAVLALAGPAPAQTPYQQPPYQPQPYQQPYQPQPYQPQQQAPLYDPEGGPPAQPGAGRFSRAELEQMLQPIALYPDPLLAQLLPAAAYPSEIESAAQFLNANPGANVDAQPWDPSVRALAHYPEVIQKLAQDLAWTGELGQAFATQMTDVTGSIQHLRQTAYSYGNLVSTPQQTVAYSQNYVSILPTNPQVIYVPVYQPVYVFRPRPYGWRRPYVTFGLGYGCGSWLTFGIDWFGGCAFRYPRGHYWGPGGNVWNHYYSRTVNNTYVTNVNNVSVVHNTFNTNNTRVWNVNQNRYQRAQVGNSGQPYYPRSGFVSPGYSPRNPVEYRPRISPGYHDPGADGWRNRTYQTRRPAYEPQRSAPDFHIPRQNQEQRQIRQMQVDRPRVHYNVPHHTGHHHKDHHE